MKHNIIIMAQFITATQAMIMESASTKTLDEIKAIFDDPEYGDI